MSTVQPSVVDSVQVFLTRAASSRETPSLVGRKSAISRHNTAVGRKSSRQWPRTAAALFDVADGYERQAHQEDIRAEQLRLRQ
jgi:hypothetical protein